MTALPPGQRAREDFPRFGLSQFADRVPADAPLAIAVDGLVDAPFVITKATLAEVARHQQRSDFHCVTTWSTTGLQWAGWRFRDVWEQLIAPTLTSPEAVTWVHFKAADGFRARLPLSDLLGEDVLLADTLNGEPIPKRHGAPVRLVAPAHYGYKSPKHVVSIRCTNDAEPFKPATPLKMMEHPRARVAEEERGRAPAWLLRPLYRRLIKGTVRQFETASRKATGVPD